MEEPQLNYTGQIFNHPVIINGKFETNPQILTTSIDWILTRYDFDKIIRGKVFG